MKDFRELRRAVLGLRNTIGAKEPIEFLDGLLKKKDDAKELIEFVNELLSAPDMDIPEDARIATVMLFEHAYLKKPLEKEIEMGWKKLGYLSDDGQLKWNPENGVLEVILMALSWIGEDTLNT